MKTAYCYAILILVCCSDILGGVLRVPQQIPTIQMAVDSSAQNDTVIISNGLYNETVHILKPITLLGQNTDSTLIQHSSYFVGYSLRDTTIVIRADSVSIQQMTITSSSDAAIIDIDSCRAIDFRSVSISGASGKLQSPPSGDGVRISNSSAVQFMTSTVNGGNGIDAYATPTNPSNAGNGGNAFLINGSDSVTIESCIIRGGAGGQPSVGRGGSFPGGITGNSIIVHNNSFLLLANSTVVCSVNKDSTSTIQLSNTLITSVDNTQGNHIQTPEYYLFQNYPNPFNPSTIISFSLPSRSFVSLKVYDILGREISTIVFGELPAGSYTRLWNGVNMPSGVYLCRLVAGTYDHTKQFILLK